MEVSEIAVRLVLSLFPGIVAALIIERLTVHKEWGQFRFALYSLVLGLISYVATQLLVSAWNLVPCARDISLSFWQVVDGAKVPLNYAEIASVVLVAAFLGVFVSAAITKKILHRVARKFGVTDKYGDESLFYFFLNSSDVHWVRISIFDENKIFEGRRESFSESSDSYEVLLREVRVYRLSDSQFLYALDSVYLSSSKEKMCIEMPEVKGG